MHIIIIGRRIWILCNIKANYVDLRDKGWKSDGGGRTGCFLALITILIHSLLSLLIGEMLLILDLLLLSDIIELRLIKE